jgi:hypothetical protein
MKFYTYFIVIKKFGILRRQGPLWDKIKVRCFFLIYIYSLLLAPLPTI